MKKHSYIFRNRYRFTATLKAEGVRFPHDINPSTFHNQFTVRLTDMETKKFTTFLFYDCYRNWINNIKHLDEQSLKNAFECIILDAIAVDQPLEDFIQEYGLDNNGRAIYKACEKTRTKLERFFDDLYEALEEIQGISEMSTDPF